MPSSTTKLVSILKEQGRYALADCVLEFSEAIDRSNERIARFVELVDGLKRETARLWVLNEYKCPTCGHAKTDPREIEFMEATGTCLSCDHILADKESLR